MPILTSVSSCIAAHSAAKAGGMDPAMKKFDETGAWNLPVLDGDKYLGSSANHGFLVFTGSFSVKNPHVWNSDQ